MPSLAITQRAVALCSPMCVSLSSVACSIACLPLCLLHCPAHNKFLGSVFYCGGYSLLLCLLYCLLVPLWLLFSVTLSIALPVLSSLFNPPLCFYTVQPVVGFLSAFHSPLSVYTACSIACPTVILFSTPASSFACSQYSFVLLSDLMSYILPTVPIVTTVTLYVA